MSDALLRCPNCGTTQATGGECEACHEADVRWYCPNHSPGRWLDTPTCAECAVRERVTADREARERAERERTVRLQREQLERERAESERRERDRAARTREEAARHEFERLARAARDRAARRADAGRRPHRERTEWREPPVREIPFPGRGELERVPRPDVVRPDVIVGAPVPRAPIGIRLPSAVGCVGGAVMFVLRLVVALVVLAVLALMFFGGPLRQFGMDMGQRFGVVGGVPDETERAIQIDNAGDRARAEAMLEEAAQTYRRDATALLYLARWRMDAGDLERAGQLLEEAERREPDRALVHRMLGDYYTMRARRAADAGLNPAVIAAETQTAQEHYARAR